jgi:hypothetical protein
MSFRLWLEEDYRGNHEAPSSAHSPLHDLSGTYPDDIYGPEGARFYGTREPYDYETISIIKQARNKPNMPIKIYRAVPAIITNQEKINDLEQQKKYILKHGKMPAHIKNNDRSTYYGFISDELDKLRLLPTEKRVGINAGDWVTINKSYAVEHGRSQFGRYRIISKTVPARTLHTFGDSIHEWGYNP